MAANKNLDPTSCTTASEAFKYPLPQVRQFHRSLTAELDEKNARLRTLVGGSYRQLLGTAEMILKMREDIGVVEDKLGRVGQSCGRGVVSAKATGLANLQNKARAGKHGEELGWITRMKVLEMCGVIVGRLLRNGVYGNVDSIDEEGKSLVLAAKVLVLSRLLAKSVADSALHRCMEDKQSVEDLKRKLENLRRRLLRVVERTLEKVNRDYSRAGLVHALCAYSLATSSGAKDVLWHFLRVRGKAMTLSFEAETNQKPDNPGVLQALDLYTHTLLDVQALIPRRLSEALAGLKTKALLKDEAVRELEGLRLDVCERWFGDEILFFTHYIRHDDLEGANAVEMLKGWSKKASEVLLQGLAKTLELMTEFKTVVDLRLRILEIWIKEGGKARGFDPSILLNGLRMVVNGRILQLLESRVSKLHLVATEIEATLGSWREGVTDRQAFLWDDDMLEMDISNGAILLKQGVLARTYGRNDAVSRVFKGYQTWRHLVDEIITVLDHLKKQRWDDDLEDIEDDLSLESRNNLLSVEDPQLLHDHLHTSLEKAYQELHGRIALVLVTHEDNDQTGQLSVYILRIIRDIRTDLPTHPSLQNFGLQMVPSLHQRLASTLSTDSIEAFGKVLAKKRVAGRALWEGNPELPVQPSPGTFKLLHSLVLAMAKAGGDLWSPVAVSVFKRHLREEIGRRWISDLKSEDENTLGKANGATSNGDAEGDEHQDLPEIVEDPGISDYLIQCLFDVLVLQCSFEVSQPATDDVLDSLEISLESRTELEPALRKRLQQAATEYWKRTSLLFGLLV